MAVTFRAEVQYYLQSVLYAHHPFIHNATSPIVRDPGSGSQGRVMGGAPPLSLPSISWAKCLLLIFCSYKENNPSAREHDNNFIELEIESLTIFIGCSIRKVIVKIISSMRMDPLPHFICCEINTQFHHARRVFSTLRPKSLFIKSFSVRGHRKTQTFWPTKQYRNPILCLLIQKSDHGMVKLGHY